jgi:hypothetical protein
VVKELKEIPETEAPVKTKDLKYRCFFETHQCWAETTYDAEQMVRKHWDSLSTYIFSRIHATTPQKAILVVDTKLR